MLYKYITKNNLEDCQSYMYSEFKGIEFIDTYRKSRQNLYQLKDNDEGFFSGALLNTYIDHEKKSKLCKLYLKTTEKNVFDEDIKKQVDFFIKVFELRKRIYNEYVDSSYKPVEESGYENFCSYIAFGFLLCFGYEKTGNIKYLNTLLKLNDVLLSLYNMLADVEKNLVWHLCKQELSFTETLLKNNDGCLREGEK